MTVIAILFGLALGTTASDAQQSGVTDTIAGRVISPDSTPIPAAHIIVTAPSGWRDSVLTDSAGQFILCLDAAGDVELTARAFGYHQLSVIVLRDTSHSNEPDSMGTRIVRELVLNPVAVVLEPVKVVSRVRFDEQSAGGTGQNWPAFLAENLPVDLTSTTDLAAIQPGVERVGPDGSGLSVAGQDPTQNRTTIDGSTYEGGHLPAEGVRSLGMIVNTFDPAYGLFSGGQVSATTLGGTDTWGGSLSARVGDPRLEFGTVSGSAIQDQRSISASGGAGGPISADHLFAFGAFDLSRIRAPAITLQSLDQSSLQRLQLSPDSAQRFLGTAGALGIPAGPSITTSQNDFYSYLARLDYIANATTSVTARVAGSRSSSTAVGASPLILPSTASGSRSTDLLASAQITSAWAEWGNQFQVSRETGGTHGGATGRLPAGEVEVVSSFPGGVVAPSAIEFGGAPFFSTDRHSLTEVRDDVVRQAADATHRLEAGILIQDRDASTRAASDPNGFFTFNSLADLGDGHPSSYARDLGAAYSTVRRLYAGLYGGDSWTPRASLTLTYGVRVEGAWYTSGRAIADQAIPLAAGAVSRPAPEFTLAPRLGVAYQQRRWTIQGGVGSFLGPPDLTQLASTFLETGLTTPRLVCVGPTTPTPSWRLYETDSSAIPSQCSGEASLFTQTAPSVAVFDRQFGSPRSWRASLGGGWALSPRWGASANVLWVAGTHIPNATDRNLSLTPRFLLTEEGNRPVYVSPSAIDEGSGGIAPSGSRRDTALGVVQVISSRAQSRTVQATLGTSGFFGRALLALSYTFTRSRLLESAIPTAGAPAGATNGDPTSLDWFDNQFVSKHVFQIVATRSLGTHIYLGAIGRLSSGVPFTPLVGGDINGDGFENDRAFIFDAATTSDTALRAGMRRLEDNAPDAIRHCLRKQVGRIAGSASCQTPWSPSLDLSLKYYALGDINTRRLLVTLTASSVTAGVDYLLHGPNHLRGWGQFPDPDGTLLQVRAFDAERNAFTYAVNPHFGQPLNGGLLNLPFRLTLQARITIGSDPRYQPLLNAIRGEGATSAAGIRASVQRFVHNVPAVTLQLAAEDTSSLRLTIRQRGELKTLADSLEPSVKAAIDSLTASLQERGAQSAARSARLQRRMLQAQAVMQAGVVGARRLLTPAQWALMPEWVIRQPTDRDLERPTFEVVAPLSEP